MTAVILSEILWMLVGLSSAVRSRCASELLSEHGMARSAAKTEGRQVDASAFQASSRNIRRPACDNLTGDSHQVVDERAELHPKQFGLLLLMTLLPAAPCSPGVAASLARLEVPS